MDGLWQDFKYAVRLVRRSSRNSAIAVAILALGIGANTAMFSAVNHVLLRPLPFAQPDRLVRLRDAVVSADGRMQPSNMRARSIVAVKAATDIFEGVVGFGGTSMTLIGGTPERLSVVRQTDGNERTLDVRPALGRGFSADESQRGAASGVAIISDSLWKSRFGGAAAALGSVIRLDDRQFVVIGVMPPLYAFPYNAQVWIPADLDTADRSQDYAVFARMGPGVTTERVRAALQSVAIDLRQSSDIAPTFVFEVMTIQENLTGNQSSTLRALTMVVGFVLLTACINVATLLLARSVARRREFAIRAVLGGTQARHLRQLLAEGLVLAMLGCAAGLLVAQWLSDFAAALIPSVLSEQLGLATLHTDWRVTGFAIGAALASACIAALIPAFGSWRANPRAALADGGRSTTGGHGGRLLGALVIAETALTLVLVAGAGLMIQNFLRLRSQPLGFGAAGLVTMEMVPSAAYARVEARSTLVRRIVEQVQTIPGMSAAITTVNPLGGGTWSAPVVTPEAAARDPFAVFSVNHRLITPGLFDTMGIPLLRGRGFGEQDRAGAPPVAIVSARMARTFWPDQDAVGKRIRVARPGTDWLTVVGVAGDVSDAHDPGVPLETWYLPYAQHANTPAAEGLYLMARRRGGDTAAAIPTIQQAIWRVDKTLAPFHVSAMDDYWSGVIARERAGALFMLGLAAFGLVLAALGVYGVTAFSVAQRTAEIGIRMALGGARRDILPLILRRSLTLITAGLGAGLVAAAALNRLLSTLLTEVGRLDGAVIGGAAASILLAALVASLMPALKASRLDPLLALRSE